MIGVVKSFSPSYALARVKFLESATEAGLPIESHVHPLPGRDDEVLAMDVVRDGPLDADKLLILTSACHGVEGYCGSGVQVFALNDEEWRAKSHAQGVAVLYIHALNPYGFSHVHRTTHENVDLNRNFQDFSQPLPVNEAYREISALLLPEQWPPDVDNDAAIARYVAQHGATAFQAAFSRGQYEFADGCFFGGTAPTWSNLTLRNVLRQHATRATHAAWIDLHTGLGPSGLGERIFACIDDPAALVRARQWWGGNGATPVTSIYDGSSTSAFLTGLMWMAFYQECPQAQYTAIAMEYGTVPWEVVTEALRGDHWLRLHPDASPELRQRIKQKMMDAFYTDTDVWRGQIISQARQAMFQAVDGLAPVFTS